MNKIISISGSSGVGKTTISRLISLALPNEKTLVLSGDDLHRWERGDVNWKKITHLNPEANNLLLGFEHLKTLKGNNKITRQTYNHDTGKFDEGVTVYPSKFIVYEGLHALYDVRTRDISWIKIFVDTDEELKKEWKMKRDTKKRGYTKKQVEDAIKRREKDERKYINPQKDHADLIIRFKKKNEKIILECEVINEHAEELVHLLEDAYTKHSTFIEVCNELSNQYELVQSRGGNVSYKLNDKLIITSSGSKMSDVTFFGGNCVCNVHLLPSYFEHDDFYRDRLYKSKLFESSERPSMETGVHCNLEGDILHTHPIYLNTILSSKEAKSIIDELFGEMDYEFIPYCSPGVELTNLIASYRQSSVYFLENHGLVVCSDDLKEAYETTKYINDTCKDWLMSKSASFIEFNHVVDSCYGYVFPDAVALSDDNMTVNCYIINTISELNLTPKFLTDSEISKLQNMESEKYRSQLV